MSNMEIINVLLAIGMSVLGWLAREMWSSVRSLADDLVELKEQLSLNYVRRDDFRDFKNEVLHVLQRIEGKLDTKQDK